MLGAGEARCKRRNWRVTLHRPWPPQDKPVASVVPPSGTGRRWPVLESELLAPVYRRLENCTLLSPRELARFLIAVP